MSVVNNISSLNAWRQLNKNQMGLSSSLEKLSSGYRINRAGDDPAGLVLSEQLRAQITGLKQAVRNTQDAASMIQTAEGAMQEMHSTLNELRALVLHAKNTGVADSTSIAADQTQIDEAISALDRIANNTLFGGKNLLDGSLTNRGTVLDKTHIQSVTVGSTAPAGTNVIAAEVTVIASQAVLTGNLALTGADAAHETEGGTMNVNGQDITIAAGLDAAGLRDRLNSEFSRLGIDATASADVGGTDFVTVTHNKYGSAYSVTVNDDHKDMYSAAGFHTDAGTDIKGKVGDESTAVFGSGLTLVAQAGSYTGTSVTMTASGNSVAAYSNAIQVDKGGLTFQVGSSATDTVNAAITDVRATALGTTAGGSTGLNSIKTGGAYSLATDPATALSVIDEAINDVSDARAKLGAIQKYTLETKINSLNVSVENVTASESRVRDTDMALEMANYTKNTILMQSATAMLAQANSVPQNILTLLGR